MKRILVIGAGYSGVLTTKHLAKKFKKDKDIEITIVDRNSYHTMLTELHEVAAGRVHEDSIKMDLNDIFAHRGVNVVLDEIKSIDFENKKALSDDAEYEYDYLVIGTGCKPTFFGTPGVEHAFQLWSYEDAVKLREHILTMFRMAMATKDKEQRKKLLTFVVVGSGFTGVEMAGELGEYKDELCETYRIPKDEVTIVIMDRVEHVLPLYPQKLVQKVEKRFAKLGVDILCGAAVTEIKEDSLVCEKGQIDTHTVIWAAGVEGSELVDNTDSITKQGRGRFATNSYLQSVDRKDVYIIGDNIFYIPEGETMPVPQMVENAELCSKLVTHNLYVDIKGGTHKEYKPVFQGSMVCVGGKWGVAYIGKKGKKTSLSGFPAMFVKHFVNMIYFMEVLGLHKVYSYLKHEIFTVKRNRSLVGGHLSNENSAPGFLLFPLRVFLGLMWLVSGVTKLPKIFEDWTNVFLLPPNPIDSASSATDAVSSATGEVADAVTSATGQVVDAISSATGATDTMSPVASVPDGIEGVLHNMEQIFELSAAKAAPVPEFITTIMTWMNETFFWSSEGGFTVFAAIAQSGIIVTEVIIGLMFIFGFLTPVAGILSFILMLVIYFSGWSFISIFFFGFAGLACMFSGNVLGVDYYFLPWLNKKLRKWKFTKKWYFYFK